MASLVLPVSRSDGTPAVLKLQPVDDENVGESLGLRVWAGRGAVLLLDEDPDAGVLLLERLDPDRSLASLPIDDALAILVGLLARLVAEPAPAGLRRLADVAAAMVEDTPSAVGRLADLADRRLISRCAAMVREVLPEPGDRLLHWDLHYENVLAGTREPWLAIDPKPLAGDPGFDLLPALWNRWDDVVATADVPRAVLRRFDLMVEVLGLERQRAVAWSLARVLQNALWDVADGETTVDGPQRTIAEALTSR
jgi:streptomycin 6-kinase